MARTSITLDSRNFAYIAVKSNANTTLARWAGFFKEFPSGEEIRPGEFVYSASAVKAMHEEYRAAINQLLQLITP